MWFLGCYSCVLPQIRADRAGVLRLLTLWGFDRDVRGHGLGEANRDGKHRTTMDNPLNRLGVIVITLWKSNIVMENEWKWYVHESEMVHCQVWLSKSLAVNQRTGMTPGFCTVHLNLSNRIYHWQLWIIWQNPGEWLRIMEAMNKLDSPNWANWSNCWVPKQDMELTSKDNLLMAMDIWPTFACVLLCCHFLSFLKCFNSTFFLWKWCPSSLHVQ